MPLRIAALTTVAILCAVAKASSPLQFETACSTDSAVCGTQEQKQQPIDGPSLLQKETSKVAMMVQQVEDADVTAHPVSSGEDSSNSSHLVGSGSSNSSSDSGGEAGEEPSDGQTTHHVEAAPLPNASASVDAYAPTFAVAASFDKDEGTSHDHTTPGSAQTKREMPAFVVLEVETSLLDKANTETGVLASFEVNDKWTPEMTLCTAADYGEIVRTHANLTAWPSRVKLTASGTDAYGFKQVVLRWGNLLVTVLSESEGSSTYGPDTWHWVDANEAAPTSLTFDIPKISWLPPINVTVNCTTAENPLSADYTTARVGTPCVFGSEPQDEGYHCIYDDGQYGSFGWCWTRKDKSSWGSCSEECPLFGDTQVLGDTLEDIEYALSYGIGPATPLS